MRLKILLVDDQKEIRNILIKKLEIFSNILIVEATSGEEAISIVKFQTFDIIISDLCMEPIDGLSFYAHIKEQKINTPFILFSSSEIELPIMELPFIEYVQKPNFNRIAQLIKRLKSA